MQQQQADGSYQELWPKVDGWNKSQVLSNLTRELLGLESTSIPDDAFIALTIGKDSKAYRVKVTYPNGQPAVGFTVGGLTAFPALGLVTNANGMVMGSSTSTNPTITVAQKYDDVSSYSGSFTSTRMITDCLIVLSYSQTPIEITSSTNYTTKVSSYAKGIEYLLVGGGRYGGSEKDVSTGGRWIVSGGGGGGGRYIENSSVNIQNLSQTIFNITIGSRGTSNLDDGTGSDGGMSILAYSQREEIKTIAQASGGKGGLKGTANSTTVGVYTRTTVYGGVGGAGGVNGSNGKKGGYIDVNYNEEAKNWGDFGRTSPVSPTNPVIKILGNKNYKVGGGGGGGPAKNSAQTDVASNALASDSYGGGGGGLPFVFNSNHNTSEPKSGLCAFIYTH